MPADLRDRIADDIRAVASEPAIAERLAALGQTIRAGTPAEFTTAIDERYVKMAAIVTSIGNGLGR